MDKVDYNKSITKNAIKLSCKTKKNFVNAVRNLLLLGIYTSMQKQNSTW